MFVVVCGNEGAFFRLRSSGAWRVTGGPFAAQGVSFDDEVDHKVPAAYTAAAKKVLPGLTAEHAYTILTSRLWIPVLELRMPLFRPWAGSSLPPG